MITSKTMETSTKHRKAKHLGWILHFYVVQSKEKGQTLRLDFAFLCCTN